MRKNIIMFVLGMLVMGGASYAADLLLDAKSISYSSEYTSTNNVADALNDLLGKANATAEDILNGKTAYVNGKLITGTALSYQDAYDEGYETGYNDNLPIYILYIKLKQSNYPGTNVFYFKVIKAITDEVVVDGTLSMPCTTGVVTYSGETFVDDGHTYSFEFNLVSCGYPGVSKETLVIYKDGIQHTTKSLQLDAAYDQNYFIDYPYFKA